MKKNNSTRYLVALLLFLIIGALVFGLTSNSASSSQGSKLRVVAGENFWGSLVAQIGGKDTQVFSIVSDPNADPHEYESNANDARRVENANYVIENGAGYDDWLTKLVSASPSDSRKVLNVSNLVGVKTGGNPHMWYNPTYVDQVAKQMELNLIKLKPSDKAYFESQYAILTRKLDVYQNNIKQIAKKYKGTQVAATEDIFYYLAQAAHLNLISPSQFTEAVAEGNDPPASTVAMFQNQLNAKQPRVLVYNIQTVTPLTTSIKNIARANNIPVIGVTETIQPPSMSFETWMNDEILNLNKALETSKA
jgi:zinc/manganese transport system substrate-binding protein